MLKIRYLTFISISFLVSGCATITDKQRSDWEETIPLCFSDSDCKTKWAAARQWIQNNAGYKIQIYSDDLIETYNPQQSDPKIAVSASKNPIAKTQEGEQANMIAVKIYCGNIFSCIPSINESILSFNKFVSQAEVTDPACFESSLANLEKPKIGYNSYTHKGVKRIVKRVCSDTPASRGSMKVNDVITRIGNKNISSEQDFFDASNSIDFGQTVEFAILRDNIPQVLTVTVPSKQEFEKLVETKDATPLNETPQVELKLESLRRLLDRGIISQDEFNVKKKQLLNEL